MIYLIKRNDYFNQINLTQADVVNSMNYFKHMSFSDRRFILLEKK